MQRSTGLMVGLGGAAAALLFASYVAALDEGARAPALTGRALGGSSVVDLSAHRGSVIVVDFWASWCGPCAEAMPALERLYQQYRAQGLVVIGVSEDDAERNARGFLSQTRVTFPVMLDSDHSVANRYRPATMPSTFVIDRRGVVRHVHSGYRAGDAAALERQIRDLL
ncbi:MAG: TlpA family protein disulfide reductase [Sandaracinaceae bacterium]|nr:TlpA family protein disulfide reductase [Sandaracinaceae bacterium]